MQIETTFAKPYAFPKPIGKSSSYRSSGGLFLGWMLLFGFAATISCSREDPPKGYPSKPIEVVVPFAPGGGSDTFARLLKAEVDKQGLLPHPLVILNVPGAGGSIGSRRVANEAADGYSVLLLHDAMLTARISGKALHGREAFEPVAGTGTSVTLIVVHEDSPYSDLKTLLSAAGDYPDTITFAANLGAPSHFVGLMLEQDHGSAKFRFAQTGGGADRFASVKGQHANATALSLDEYIRFRSDGIKAIALMGSQRHQQIPEVPTAIEQGFAVEHQVTQYWWMPKGTPISKQNYLANVLKQVLHSSEFQAELAKFNIDPIFLDGQDLSSHLDTTETALMRVDPGTQAVLPNLHVLLFASATLLSVLLIMARRLSHKQRPLSLEKDATGDAERKATSPWFLPLISTASVIAYSICLFVFHGPLGPTTGLFVGTLGFVIAWRDGVIGRNWVTGSIAASAIGLGVLFHYVFTEIFGLGF